MEIPLLDLKGQYKLVKETVQINIERVLDSAHYINGPLNKKFEEQIKSYISIKHAIGVANGTDALVLALEALGIGVGDEVITTTFTYYATAEAIAYVGATPVFVDVDLNDYNILVSKIEEKITKNTKAIIAVHIFGNPCDMDEINIIAKKNELYVIEDAAQAIGSSYKGKMIGSLSDIATFSFFPTKNLGAYGDGGMITTDSDELATIITALKTHGSGSNGKKAFDLLNGISNDTSSEDLENQVYSAKKYYNYIVGHNSRLDEIQAAVLISKLPYLDSWNKKRNKNAEEYNNLLFGVKHPGSNNQSYSCYHLYVIQSENRADLVEHLKKNGISTGVYYPVPMHLQEVFKYLGYKEGDLPNSEYLSKRTLAIPAHEMLEKKEVKYIIDKVNSFKEK